VSLLYTAQVNGKHVCLQSPEKVGSLFQALATLHKCWVHDQAGFYFMHFITFQHEHADNRIRFRPHFLLHSNPFIRTHTFEAVVMMSAPCYKKLVR